MRLGDFDYTLPPELIATHPAERRDASRLMVLPRIEGAAEHRVFSDLTALLRAGDCLVLNDSRVLPARLEAVRPSGGKAELLLLNPAAGGCWEAMVRPARKLTPGTLLSIPGEGAQIEVVSGDSGRTRMVRLVPSGDMRALLERRGAMPLPPYIVQQRAAQGEPEALPGDRERYQTVYAAAEGSAAAPTAGLHFTPELLAALESAGIEIARVTLHVGAGTFAPVEHDDPRDHPMHAESYAIDAGNSAAIEAARRDPERRVVAVGTTAARTLESVVAEHGGVVYGAGSTSLFIYPGYTFGAIDGMITNFHLPRSTLLMLVAALAGRDRLMAAYAEAMEERYRFYSYGDAMLIL